ncbi:MAG: DMT family transporter [Planctomycetota bacterium]
MGSKGAQSMHVKRGLLVMLLSSVFFAVMSALIRKLSLDSPHISPYTVAMVRFLVGNLCVLLAFLTGVRKMQWTNWRWIAIRGSTGGYAVIAYFWTIAALGLAKGALYSYTYPIFAALFAIPILGERLTAGHWLAVALAGLGIGVFTGAAELSLSPSEVIGLSVGVTSAMAVVALTKCRETDSSTNIFWSQCLFGLAMVLWPMWTHWVWPTQGEWMMLFLIASLSVVGQLTMTNAYKFTGATYGSLLGLLSPLLSTIIAVAAFNEELRLSFWLGAGLILLPCGYLSFRPIQRTIKKAPQGGDGGRDK